MINAEFYRKGLHKQREAIEGELKTSPMQKPLHKPDTNSSLTNIPEDWNGDNQD